MQKKAKSAKKNKKAPQKGASNLKKRSMDNDFLFEDKYIGVETVKAVNKNKIKKSKYQEDKFIGAEEVPKINKKKLKKIKKQKKKEKARLNKEIRKQEKAEEKQRVVHKKRLTAKQIKKRQKIKRVTTYLFVAVLVIAAIALFLLSPIFNISKIEVKGNSQVSSNEIISLSRIEKGMNLFSINKREIVQSVKENPFIESVNIKRNLPNGILITVTERNIDFLLEFGGSYAYIDKQGYILQISSENISDKQKIAGYKTLEENIKPGNRLCEEDLDCIYDFLHILNVAENYSLKQLITSINISDNSNYVLYLESERKTVNLGTTDNIETKMLFLQSILEREKDNEGIIFLNVDFKDKDPYGRFN